MIGEYVARGKQERRLQEEGERRAKVIMLLLEGPRRRQKIRHVEQKCDDVCKGVICECGGCNPCE